MTHWSADYLALPFAPAGRTRAGLDCWGLVQLVYRERLGIELPGFEGRYVTTDDRADIARIVAGEAIAGPWVAVEAGDEREYDVAVFRCFGLESHVGVIVGDGRFLHVSSAHESRIERYRDGRWINRFEGAWRHRSKL